LDINCLFHILFLSASSPNAENLKISYQKLGFGPHVSPRHVLDAILEAIEQVKPRFTEEIRSFGFTHQVVDSISNEYARPSDSIWGQTVFLRMVRKLFCNLSRNKRASRTDNAAMVILPYM
jgi:hypothetical protein